MARLVTPEALGWLLPADGARDSESPRPSLWIAPLLSPWLLPVPGSIPVAAGGGAAGGREGGTGGEGSIEDPEGELEGKKAPASAQSISAGHVSAVGASSSGFSAAAAAAVPMASAPSSASLPASCLPTSSPVPDPSCRAPPFAACTSPSVPAPPSLDPTASSITLPPSPTPGAPAVSPGPGKPPNGAAFPPAARLPPPLPFFLRAFRPGCGGAGVEGVNVHTWLLDFAPRPPSSPAGLCDTCAASIPGSAGPFLFKPDCLSVPKTLNKCLASTPRLHTTITPAARCSSRFQAGTSRKGLRKRPTPRPNSWINVHVNPSCAREGVHGWVKGRCVWT